MQRTHFQVSARRLPFPELLQPLEHSAAVSTRNSFLAPRPSLRKLLHLTLTRVSFKLFDRPYVELVSAYRDVALLKALYWRMFPVFRWLVQRTSATGLTQSAIFSAVKDLASIADDSELESEIKANANLSQNLAIVDQFL